MCWPWHYWKYWKACWFGHKSQIARSHHPVLLPRAKSVAVIKLVDGRPKCLTGGILATVSYEPRVLSESFVGTAVVSAYLCMSFERYRASTRMTSITLTSVGSCSQKTDTRIKSTKFRRTHNHEYPSVFQGTSILYMHDVKIVCFYRIRLCRRNEFHRFTCRRQKRENARENTWLRLEFFSVYRANRPISKRLLRYKSKMFTRA